MRYGRRRDPWAGFKVDDVQSLPQAILAEVGVTVTQGCLVRNILRTAPAYESGLRPGDVIVGINGQRVDSASDIDFVLWDLFIGDPCTLTVNRKGQEDTVKFLIQELSNSP